MRKLVIRFNAPATLTFALLALGALLLGQTGPISAESWEEKKDYYQKNNYNMDAIAARALELCDDLLK